MNISISETKKPARITILHLEGSLDGANFQSLIDEAKKLYASGTRDLLLDLGKLTFISSAGLAALHQVALLFLGKKHPGQDDSWADFRWAAYNNINPGKTRTPHQHVKLFSPTQQVLEVLEMIGFCSLFDIFTDLHLATASFIQASPAL